MAWTLTSVADGEIPAVVSSSYTGTPVNSIRFFTHGS